MIPVKDNIPNDRFPLVTVGLMLGAVVVYIVTAVHGGSLIGGPDRHELVTYGAIPDALIHGRRLGTALSALFLHASIVQLVVNLLFLWIFGNSLEDAMGQVAFLLFFLAGGIVALGVTVAIAPHAADPTVGGAGGVAAVLAGYAVIYPRGRVLTLSLIPMFFTVVETPVMVMVALWVAVQAVFAATGLIDPVGGTGAAAYLSYAGGAVLGAVTVIPVARRRKPVPPTAAAYR